MRRVGEGEVLIAAAPGPAFDVMPGSRVASMSLDNRSPARRVGPLILDASVLIGLLDREDPHHTRAVDEIEAADRAERELVTPASAYSEALVAFARADRIADAREAISAIGIIVAPLSARIAERAAHPQSHSAFAASGPDATRSRDRPRPRRRPADLRRETRPGCATSTTLALIKTLQKPEFPALFYIMSVIEHGWRMTLGGTIECQRPLCRSGG